MTDEQIMSIDEAINHCYEVANSNDKMPCDDCKSEHKQLAKWLEELKTNREIINHQKAKIERLNVELTAMRNSANTYKSLYEDLKTEHLETIREIKKAKSEAAREFWDRLKKESDFISGGDYGFSFEIREDVANDIIEGMVGDRYDSKRA